MTFQVREVNAGNLIAPTTRFGLSVRNRMCPARIFKRAADIELDDCGRRDGNRPDTSRSASTGG